MSERSIASWFRFRSAVYERDKGICWVCNAFTEPQDYQLGHLVDLCMGGQTCYGNLVVMHRHCNLSKPRHPSIQAAMEWKLNPSYLPVITDGHHHNKRNHSADNNAGKPWASIETLKTSRMRMPTLPYFL